MSGRGNMPEPPAQRHRTATTRHASAAAPAPKPPVDPWVLIHSYAHGVAVHDAWMFRGPSAYFPPAKKP